VQRAFAAIARCAAIVMVGLLGACIEVEQSHTIDRSGDVHLRVVLKIDPQYEQLVFSDMEKKLRQDMPPSVRVDSSQRVDGKASFIIEADGKDATELSRADYPVTLVVSDAGFMQRRYQYRVVVAKTPETPVPHRLRVTLPGTIEQTNGKKLGDDTAEFDLTRARRGASFVATSKALAFSLPGARSNLTQANAGASSAVEGRVPWLLWGSFASILAGLALVIASWVRARANGRSAVLRPPPLDMPTPAAMPNEVAAVVYCSECGTQNPAARKFCRQCGHSMVD
jgi:ribosomal protein L40E